MPSSNLPDPDKIPDMSLDDRRDRPPSNPPSDVSYSYQVNRIEPTKPGLAESAAPPPDWQEGDRVLAPWEPTFLYAGAIRQIKIDEATGDQALIKFRDGGEGWVLLDSLCPLEFKVGLKVECRRYQGAHFSPATVSDVSGEEVRVRFDAGGDEWTTLATLRIPCIENGPGVLRATNLAQFQTPDAGSTGSAIPSWAIWIGVSVLLAFVRIACREAARN